MIRRMEPRLLFDIAILIILLAFLRMLWLGAPYVPSLDATVETMIMLAGVQSDEKAVDLGAGNGKIVIALAKAGAEAHGYEINPLLVWRARRNIRKAGLEGKALIHRKNFWKKDLSEFSIVTLYGASFIMKKLEAKLKKELRPGARVISNAFQFPTWQSIKQEGKVYCYIVTKKNGPGPHAKRA